jgi:ankyrin repeat protein
VAGDQAIHPFQTFDLLLAHGADINARTRNGGQTLLMFAAQSTNVEQGRNLLSRHADATCKLRGYSALYWARYYQFPEMIRLLKQAGAQD